MYASYNNFKHNIHRDAMIITVADTLTSVLAGSVVFAILGTLAFDLKQDIKNVVKDSGLRLAFVAYPEALGHISFAPQLWSILFFIMLYMLGLGSAVSISDKHTGMLKKSLAVLRSATSRRLPQPSKTNFPRCIRIRRTWHLEFALLVSFVAYLWPLT